MSNTPDNTRPEIFLAPRGSYRVTCENMNDGEVEIVGDFSEFKWAKLTLDLLRENTDNDVFIYLVCDDQGKEVEIG